MDGETYDYGLDPDEQFIPEDLDDADVTLTHIMTVLGPIAPGALGVTNASAELATLVSRDRESINDALIHEIEEAGFAGIGAFVSNDKIARAADVQPLRWLAERSNLHVVFGQTPLSLGNFDDEIEELIDVVTNGIGTDGVRPGYLRAPFEALSLAYTVREETGIPVVALLSEADVDMLVTSAPDELEGTIARPIGSVDIDRMTTLIDHGAWLLLDSVQGASERDRELAETVSALATAGYLESLLLGYSPQSVPESVSYGVGSRWSYLIEQFPLLVLEAGLDARAMRTIMIENPNAAFTIYPPQ
jgi:predicted metal-dependent phosphotriesterase family hydrolase